MHWRSALERVYDEGGLDVHSASWRDVMPLVSEFADVRDNGDKTWTASGEIVNEDMLTWAWSSLKTAMLSPRQRASDNKLLRTMYPEREIADNQATRPTRRCDCVDGPRPCPWVSCRHHLAIDVTDAGSIKSSRGHALDDISEILDAMPETCALDVADQGEHYLSEVSEILGIVKEDVRVIEERAMAKIRAAMSKEMVVEMLKSEPARISMRRIHGALRQVANGEDIYAT